MPLTFPSHAAAVLPIKIAWPRRWDGVALVIGSTAPDLPYALSPYVELDTHAWLALLWFCVPITLFGTWLIRPAAPAIAAHLPNLGRFALHDYGVLGRARHRAYVTVWSALVGAVSHLGWDTFTHERATRIWTFLPLDHVAFAGQPWWHVLQMASTVIGALVTVVLAWHVGRKRLLIAWHGRPQVVTTQPARFWTVTIAVGLTGIATLPLLAQSGMSYVLGARLLIIGAVALLAGSAAVRPTRPARRVGLENPAVAGAHAGDRQTRNCSTVGPSIDGEAPTVEQFATSAACSAALESCRSVEVMRRLAAAGITASLAPARGRSPRLESAAG